MSLNEAPMAFNQNYQKNNPMAPMSPAEVDQMRKRLLDNISDLNANKHRFHADEYHQLSNYHHYALTILDNIKIIRLAEASDPYNLNLSTVRGDGRNIDTINPYEKKMDVVYRRDGKAVMVDGPKKFRGEWEQQFDQNVINGQCFSLPPSNLWGLPPKI